MRRPRLALTRRRLNADMAKLTTLQWALIVSLGAHGGLLAFRIADPQRFERTFKDTPLEVILVNARSNERPT